MADSKITALTSIGTSTDPVLDQMVIVDVSDGSMAATGTTKKVSLNQLLATSPTATLASATITGDLTAARLIVTGGTIPTNGLWLPTTNTLEFAANSLAQYRIAPLGVFSWYDGAGGTRMTLNATGLGVGVTPSAKLHVEGTGPQARFSVASASDARHEYYRNGVREGLLFWSANVIGLYATEASGELVLASANTIRVRINSAGDTISNVTSTAPTLATNSQMVFNLTSNTNLRISVRGTDGVTRTANLTLA